MIFKNSFFKILIIILWLLMSMKAIAQFDQLRNYNIKHGPAELRGLFSNAKLKRFYVDHGRYGSEIESRHLWYISISIGY